MKVDLPRTVRTRNIGTKNVEKKIYLINKNVNKIIMVSHEKVINNNLFKGNVISLIPVIVANQQ